METSLIYPLRTFAWIAETAGSSFKVAFPKASDMDLILIGAELYQNMESHDRLVLHFKGTPFLKRSTIASGDPVIFTIIAGDKSKVTWYGYINHSYQNNTLQGGNTDIICIGSSWVFKDTDQAIYKNLTSDQIVSRICAKHGFNAVTQRDPRVRDTVVQAGQSDWQVLRRLAKQSGFALRAENATVFYMSKDKIYQSLKKSAPYFNYVTSEVGGVVVPSLRALGTISHFEPHISDQSPEIGVRVDRVITGVNKNTGTVIKTKHSYNPSRSDTKGVVIPSPEFFLK
jgi:hypothetical protein